MFPESDTWTCHLHPFLVWGKRYGPVEAIVIYFYGFKLSLFVFLSVSCSCFSMRLCKIRERSIITGKKQSENKVNSYLGEPNDKQKTNDDITRFPEDQDTVGFCCCALVDHTQSNTGSSSSQQNLLSLLEPLSILNLKTPWRPFFRSPLKVKPTS